MMLVFWDVWLGWWSTNFLKLPDMIVYFYVLIGLSIGIGLYILLRGFITSRSIRKIGHNMFLATLSKVVKSELGWFEYFGTGKIVFRMTTD